jgi:hypothetical protein
VAVVRVDQVEPVAKLAVVAFELEVGIFAVRIDLEDLLQALRRKIGLEEMLLVQRRQMHQDFDLLALGGHHLELLLQDGHELRPLLELLVDARQTA